MSAPGLGAYIRDYYKVPAKRGMRVVADGKPGVITGFRNQYLLIRLDGDKHLGKWHPTWRIHYLTADGVHKTKDD